MKTMSQLLAGLLGAASATLVPVTVEGKTFMVDANSIDSKDRSVEHGEYKGEKVNSPAICSIGKSVVVWPEANESPAISFSKAGFGVLATKFLQAEDHTVTLKQQ